VIDQDTGIVIRNGHFAQLTPSEFELFHLLWEKIGRVKTKQSIMDAIYWRLADDEEPGAKIVDVWICKIRKKLKPLGIEIQTAWGRGFRIIETELEKNA
jgi:DNA-binding response OmpR family regulator